MYAVEMTSETMETVLIGKFETEEAAIAAAEVAAGEAEYEGTEVSIIVNDDQGAMVWNNEGDWRNAVRS